MTDDFWIWLTKYSSGDSFQKVSALKNKYLNHDQKIKYIHVTGTNGKGSIAKYLQAVLSQELKLKVGLFTSPHILVLNERIVINDEMISDQNLLKIKDLISEDVDKYQLGFFAILTLIALIYFQEQKVDWAIIEVGIGGLLDTTNIIRSDYCVVSSIARDHKEVLGSSLLAVLKQKLGIVKQTTQKLFLSGNLSIALKKATTKLVAPHVKIYFSKKIINQGYILENQTLALLVATILFPNFDDKVIWNIIINTQVNLRFQKLNFQNKIIYFDVAHNLAGIQALINLIKLNNITIDQIIFSALKTKNPKLLIKKLKSNLLDKFYICKNNHPLTIKAEEFVFEKMILQEKENSIILVTGSCYFVAQVYQEFLTRIKN